MEQKTTEIHMKRQCKILLSREKYLQFLKFSRKISRKFLKIQIHIGSKKNTNGNLLWKNMLKFKKNSTLKNCKKKVDF